MAEVYYYIPLNEADYAVECGLKLTKWQDKEVLIENEYRACLSALLNPKDDIDKYNSNHLCCVKLELPPKYCYIADKYLYEVGLNNSQVMEMYTKSIVPIEKYTFGSYRLPECLIVSTVITGQISILNKKLDSPILFDSSEELYVNNIIENNREQHVDFNNTLLFYFFSKLAETEKVDKIVDEEKNIAVFINRTNDKSYVLKVPDINVF